jgi:hypothetical protein
LWLLSKSLTFQGKYRKCQKKRKHYIALPIPGSPRTISRESGDEKILAIPGVREREVLGMNP